MDFTSNQSSSSTPSGEAVKYLEATIDAEEGNTAAWKVVRPKGKKGARNAGKRPKAATPSSNTPAPVVAHVPGKLTKKQKRQLNRQHQGQMRRETGSGGPQPTAEAPPMNRPGPSAYYRERRSGQNKPVAEPQAPPTSATVSTVVNAGTDGCRGKATGSKNKNRLNRKKRAAAAIAKSAQAPARNEPSKRSRLDDTSSPRGDHKKVRLDSSRRAQTSYAGIVMNDLCVAVTRDDNAQLSDEQVTLVKKFLQRKILEGIKDPAIAYSPSFNGKPVSADGVLKLWCEDERSLRWLTEVIDSMPSMKGTKFVVRKQGELTRRVRAALFLPECENTLEDTNLVLDHQNKWALVNTWTVFTHTLQRDGTMFLTLGIPESVVPALLERGRRLSHNLGKVYVRFYGADGSLSDEPPRRDVPTSAEGTETVPPAPTHSSPKPSTSEVVEGMSVDPEPQKSGTDEVAELVGGIELKQSVEVKPDDGDPYRL